MFFSIKKPAAVFRKQKKKRKKNIQRHVRFTFCYINCFVQRSLPPCKTTTTNTQILGELEVMMVNFLLKMKNVDYDLTHFIYVCSSL